MKTLVFVEKNRVITDSLMVAEMFCKEHKNVMRDIQLQIGKLSEAGEAKWGALNFEQTHYQHPQNKRWYQKYNLTEDAFAIVAMSYVTAEAMIIKIRFLDEFKRMRAELAKPQFQIPQTLSEALRMAANLSEENDRIAAEKEKLALKTAEQERQLKEQEAPVAIYNLAISAANYQSMAEVAKALGTGRTRLFQILREEGIIIKNQTIPYQKYIDAGYFVVRERPRATGDKVVNDVVTKVTAKGFDFIAERMQKRNETKLHVIG
ncbi:Rha family transcriptional regulator [Paenibacillus chitinolyticus]|uniref:Rha family transcriptional regulator n=1 Tax=Paenibacillus chitinolyticus TaxID=79263 RepID=UPI00366AEE61